MENFWVSTQSNLQDSTALTKEGLRGVRNLDCGYVSSTQKH